MKIIKIDSETDNSSYIIFEADDCEYVNPVEYYLNSFIRANNFIMKNLLSSKTL